MLAQVQLRNQTLRPDTTLRLSADQYRAIAEFLAASDAMVQRAKYFAELARTAELYDWPSSATAPFRVLTEEESNAIWNGPFALRQRVFAPTLTKTEREALRQHAKETIAYAQKAFAPDKNDPA